MDRPRPGVAPDAAREERRRGEAGHDGAADREMRLRGLLDVRREPLDRRPAAEPGEQEEHTSELPSRFVLVWGLLLETKKQITYTHPHAASSAGIKSPCL